MNDDFETIELDRIYKEKIYCANSAAGPTSLIISNITVAAFVYFRNTPPWGRCHYPLSLNVFVASLKTFPGKPNGKNHSKVKRVQLRKLPLE